MVLGDIVPVQCNALQADRPNPRLDRKRNLERSSDMHDQITVRLSENLGQALELAAHQMQRKKSEVVRMALEQFLQAPGGRQQTPAERVQHLIGSLETGVPDLAERHRSYVLEALQHGR